MFYSTLCNTKQAISVCPSMNYLPNTEKPDTHKHIHTHKQVPAICAEEMKVEPETESTGHLHLEDEF